MNVFQFLGSKRFELVLFALSCLCVGVILFVCTANSSIVGIVLAVQLLGFSAALVHHYLYNARFYKDIAFLSSHLEKPYQLHALIEEPLRPDQRIVYDALQTMGSVCAEEVVQAKEQSQNQRDYMETWVHEVKTPLTAALLCNERVAEPEHSLLRGDLERAIREVDQVLWYARSENPNVDFYLKELPLLQLVYQACKENARNLIEQHIALQIDIPEETMITTDEKQAKYVITQILSNATKYGANSIFFSTCSSTDSLGRQNTTLYIRDDGWGIPPEDIGRIFERGFTGKRGRSVGSSTGMGLYIAATLCKRLNIKLSASSDGVKGSSFELVFSQDSRKAHFEWEKM